MRHDGPAVTCTSCSRSWHSDTMLDGLSLLGHCPRCGGELEFHRTPRAETATPAPGVRFAREEPHLVLGRPRGRGRRTT